MIELQPRSQGLGPGNEVDRAMKSAVLESFVTTVFMKIRTFSLAWGQGPGNEDVLHGDSF